MRWAWARDRAVALAWPWVTHLRGFCQGAGLAAGLMYHRRLRILPRPRMEQAEKSGS